MKHVIVIGAGRIGRGFLAELLLANGRKPVFFAATEKTVDGLNRQGRYEIHVLGDESKNTVAEQVEAHLISDIPALAALWEHTDLIFTACGGKNLHAAGAALAAAYRMLYEKGSVPVSNIITCENWMDPAGELKQAILSGLDEQESESFLQHTGLGEAAVMCSGTGAPDPGKVTNPMDTWVENAWYLPVDARELKGTPPKLQYIDFRQDFGVLLRQKLYTRNTSIATIAYLGRLKGLNFVAESAWDPEIEPVLTKLYQEVSEILIQGFGVEREEQMEFARRAEAKNKDRAIVDVLTRVARDPLRKLGPEDRLIGPLKKGAVLQLEVQAIALGCAAALYYENPEDESACELSRLRKEKGTDYILEHVSGLDPKGPEAACIRTAIEELREKGWIEEIS